VSLVSLGRDGALVEGHVSLEGMLLPTKGGYVVRGAILDDAELREALVRSGSKQSDADALLGAIVRVWGVLKEHRAPAPAAGGVAVQTRVGTWFGLDRVEGAEVVAPAQKLEGTLGRSKGFYSVGARLISRDDVAWSLRDAKEGARVRLFGQPRDVVCEPQAQCLIGGVLPLFDVGRGEIVP
jgi:hypothetical protein